MSVGQVVAIVALLAHVYQVDPALMDCIVAHESDYRVDAVNGVHQGIAQFRFTHDQSSTWHWMVSIALEDPAFIHAALFDDQTTPYDHVQAAALLAWAIKNGYIDHWGTARLCGGEG